MLSEKPLSHIRKTVVVLEFFKVLPFTWAKGNSLKVAQSSTHLKVWRILCWHCLCYSMYNLYRLPKVLKEKERNYPEISMMIIWGTGYLVGWIIYVNLEIKKDDMVSFFTQMVKMDQKRHSSYSDNKEATLMSFLTFLFSYAVVSGVILYIVQFCVNPTQRQFVYSLLPEIYRTTYSFTLFCIFEIISKITICGLVIWQSFFMQIYTTVATYWINNLCKSKKSLEKQLEEYQSYRILNIYYNHSSISVLMPCFVALYSMGICNGSFGVIRCPGKVPTFYYFLYHMIFYCCIFIPIVLLLTSSKIHEKSSKCLLNMRNIRTRRFIQFTILGSRPFGIRFGTLRKITKSDVLNFLFHMSNIVISILVAVPKF